MLLIYFYTSRVQGFLVYCWNSWSWHHWTNLTDKILVDRRWSGWGDWSTVLVFWRRTESARKPNRLFHWW